jgi:hypothetical protein
MLRAETGSVFADRQQQIMGNPSPQPERQEGGVRMNRWRRPLVLVAVVLVGLLVAASPVSADGGGIVVKSDVDSASCVVTKVGDEWSGENFFARKGWMTQCPEQGHPYLTGHVWSEINYVCGPDWICYGAGRSGHVTADGAWDGRYVMRLDMNTMSVRVRATLRGSGAYEGMVMGLKRVDDHITARVWTLD